MSVRHRHSVCRSAAGFAAVAALSAGLLAASPAQAAPGDSFDTGSARVFIAQDDPTQLSIAASSGSGGVVFTDEGPAAGLKYNAIGFDESTGDIYGIAQTGRAADGAITAVAAGSLIRIGEDGLVTQVGAPGPYAAHVGAMYQGYLYINDGTTTLTAIDVTDGTEETTRSKTLSALPNISDFTALGDYLWSISAAGEVVRIDPASGQVDTFTTPAAVAEVFGAVWTYGNGNLGFSQNSTGQVRQISVTGPSTDTPTFALVSTSSGPPSSNNDGTASMGDPADLGIVKKGPSNAVAGQSITYELTVTNHGLGASSGFVVTDALPTGLSNPSSSDPGCTATGSSVTCTGGALAVNASQAFTITADIGDNFTGDLDNSASVTGNELDRNPDNDTSRFTTNVAPPMPSLAVTKHASLNDTNGNGTADAGETIDYSFDVENTGNVDLTDVTVNDPKVTGLDPVSADIAVGEDQLFTSEPYVVTDADVDAGEVANSATATGIDPAGARVTSDPATTTVDTTPPPGPGDDDDDALPDTGAASWLEPMLAAGLALLAAGAWLARRRRIAGRHTL